MPPPYKPRAAGLDPCPPRTVPELKEAAVLLGDTMVHGCELSFELQSLAVNPTHRSKATGQDWMPQPLMLLHDMLVAERWLIEFLAGPTSSVDPHTGKRRKRPDDICVDCYLHDWRFPAGPLADTLVARLGPINKLALHPTWALVTTSPRQWTLTRVEACLDGMAIFAHDLRPKRPTVAPLLEERIEIARQSLHTGRSDGLRQI